MHQVIGAFGTHLDERDGRLVRVADRTGCVHGELTWEGDRLGRLVVPGAIVHGQVIQDPLLGDAHAIDVAGPGGARATTMSAIDWARPTEIPAIAAPGRLPRGSGAPLMNVIAWLAERAGVRSLRYAGPYPTPALWATLARSFRTTATEAAFTADLMGRAARVARDPIAIDFTPAPHARLAIPRGHVELRDEPGQPGPGTVLRVVIDGVSYEPGGSPARLIQTEGNVDPRAAGSPIVFRAEVWFGDQPWAHVATLTPSGDLEAGPSAIPPCTSDVIGKEFPAPLRTALAELVADAVPEPAAAAARALLARSHVRWADLGARAASRDDIGFAVHAALWQVLAPQGLPRVALAIAEALAPVVTTAVVSEAMSAVMSV